MIIYGTKAVHLKTAKSNLGICPSCSTKGSLSISIYRKHFHIFWIPTFPIGKKGVSECSHCKKVMTMKEMPDSIKLEYQNLKAQTKGPIWQFSGLALIFILVLGITFISKTGSEKYNKTKQEYLAYPMQGDVYEYVIKTGKYTTLKIVNVSNDNITFSPNKLESNSIIRLYKINKEQNYSDKVYSVTKEELKKMYTDGKIMGIKRNQKNRKQEI